MKSKVQILSLLAGLLLISTLVKAQSTTWVAPSSADAVKNPFAQNEDAIKKGKKLYNQLCSICHGDRGKGDGMAGAALTPKPANFTTDKFHAQTDGAIFWKINEGRTPMAAYKDILKEDERWQLVSYIRTLMK